MKILPQEQYPTCICVKCYRQILNFYAFKRKTEKNDRILRKTIRHWSIMKDIVNIVSEKSDINTAELIETQKEINSISVTTHDEFQDTQNNSVKPNNILYSSVKPSLNFETIQRQQNSFCLNYNMEPPPLVPLHSNSELKSDTKIIGEHRNTSASKNLLDSDVLQLPPLVPIIASAIIQNMSKEFTYTCRDKRNSNPNLNKCNICKKEFADQKKLIAHLNQHKEYLCNVCGKRYFTRSTFIVHFRSHTGERPFNCTICGKAFVRWAGVKNHMKTHEDFKPYKCETCGKQFKVVSNLYRHQRMHTGNYAFSCSFCGKAFFQSDHLKLHIRTYHTNEKPYLCCECGKGFVSSQRLKRHERVHSGQKPYPCSLCLRAYTSAIDLKNHNFREHYKSGNRDEMKKYACLVCSLKFRHPCRLKKHMKIHNDLKNAQ